MGYEVATFSVRLGADEVINSEQKQIRMRDIYRWVLSYLRPYQGLLAVVILCGLIATGIQSSIPKGIQWFIDDIVPNRNWSQFGWLIGGICILVAVMLGVMAIQNLVQRSLKEKAARDVQVAIFQHLRARGFAYFEQRPIGESLSFMNTEVASLQEFYRWMLPGLVQQTVLSLVSIVLLLSISVELTVIIVPCLLLYYLIGPYFERKAALLATGHTEARIAYSQKAYESIAALAELRASNAEAWDKQRFAGKMNRFLSTRVEMLWIAYWRGTVRRLSYYIGGIAVIIYGIHLVRSEALTVGGMAAFLIYYFMVMHTITVVITILTEQKVLMKQVEKIYAFMHTEPDVKETSEPAILADVQGDIQLSNVTYHYPGGPDILSGMNLHVKPGQKLALVGTSGNGKSTLLKLIVRFYDPQDGEIRLDNVLLNRLSFAQIRETIGYVFQETYLFGASVRDNILFGKPEASGEDVIAAAKAAHAHDFIMALPDGYDTLLGERGVRLSGGQKQRISIARMFIKDPAIILLDEATSALDNASEQEVQAALDELLAGRTTITVAHRLSTIQHYDQIAVIQGGKVAEIGTHEELMDRGGAYYQLVTGEATREGVLHG